MSEMEAMVASHYATGSLGTQIRAGWAQLKSQSQARPVDQLAGVDEFHIGGRSATEMVCDQLGLAPGMRVLDVGCGLGGAARYMATRYDVDVEGVDITAEYVAVGNALTDEVGLSDRVRLTVASALDLPSPDAAFDGITMFHVGMNIQDKARLFGELARVLKPGGQVAVYDVMQVGEAPLAYPVPWAFDQSTSFLAQPDDYRALLESQGLAVTLEAVKKDFALAFFAKMKARKAESGPPPLGLHLVMGPDAAVKVANIVAGIQAGAVAPVVMLATKRS
jgi:ubiquinone/menaquinone biosynthesis C-methylase UbiE